MERIALEGMRFGRLLVQARTANIGPHTAYSCICDCGTVVNVRAHCLRRGDTSSCGCLRRETAAVRQTTHSMYGSGTYNSYRAMLARCQDETHPQYYDYGGRGISVCERWKVFENFLADMGERPEGRTLDRYPNNNGNYEPGNCRWATAVEQRHNRREPQRSHQ